MEFINTTPHALVIRLGDREQTIPTSDRNVRVEPSHDREGGEIGGIPFFTNVDTGKITDLYESDLQGDAIFLVSLPIILAAKANPGSIAHRLWEANRLFSPGTGPLDKPIRENGQIKAVTCLTR